MIMKLSNCYTFFQASADCLRSPFLLGVRLFWGWQFAQTGWGKLMNLERTAGYFQSLHIPLPQVNAAMAGATECVGGALLVLGLYTRVASVPLIATMLVAYATADREALMAIVSDTEKFTSAAPFLFLLASIILLVFGAGGISVDRFLSRKTTTN